MANTKNWWRRPSRRLMLPDAASASSRSEASEPWHPDHRAGASAASRRCHISRTTRAATVWPHTSNRLEIPPSGCLSAWLTLGWRLCVSPEAAEQRELLGCAVQRRLAAAACQRQQRGRWRAAAATELRDSGKWMAGRAVARAACAITAIAKGCRCRWRRRYCRSGHAAAVVW